MKRLIMMLALLPLLCTGCAKPKEENAGKVSVMASIFPEYEWTRELLKDTENVQLSLLVQNGSDLHSYQPSVQDIAAVSSADLFLCTGGESSKWIEDAVREPLNKNQRVIRMLEALGSLAKEEETVEGMEAEEEEEGSYDEHVWLSLNNASVLVKAIAEELCRIDPEEAGTIRTNLSSYIGKLADLNARYTESVRASRNKTLVFADRFPFRYLCEDYELTYYAAFAGCSAETEASFSTVVFLAEKIDSLGLPAVCQIESADGRLAKSVLSNAQKKNVKTVTFDSMQSVNAAYLSSGKTYLSVMEDNLTALQTALGSEK